MAKKTDDSKVYDVTISDLNPDIEVVVKALKDNPKIKVNLNLENCTELKDLKIMPDGGINNSKTESFLKNLVSLTLPNGVVNIVLGCDGLTSINIPNSVKEFSIYGENPPTILNANTINANCTIYVPASAIETYKNTDGWSRLANQIQSMFNDGGVESGTNGGEENDQVSISGDENGGEENDQVSISGDENGE